MRKIFPVILLMIVLSQLSCSNNEAGFTIKNDAVEEGSYKSTALSPTKLVSNYPMETETGIKQPIVFKLSLNGDDNEGGIGQDHHLIIPGGLTEFYAPTLLFGQPIPLLPGNPADLDMPINVHFRVDLRSILNDFSRQGFTVTPTSDTIFTADFQGLYIAGNQAPLTWFWDQGKPSEDVKFQDADNDSIYELSLRFKPPVLKNEARKWELQSDLSNYPKFSSPQAPLLEALTSLALEEAELNIRDDGAFSAGKEWGGVWTRDVSYATQLSLAYLFPEASKASLRAKLAPNGRIIQDTGTGGAWPISSDRHVWILAAWEIYLATGDAEWLEEIRGPALLSLKEDILWNRDPISGLLLGETSFEDWREQTYPPWMSPSDIHASHALSTNMIFKRALEIGLALASNDREATTAWPGLIQRLDANIITHFWDEELEAPTAYMISAPAWLPARHRSSLGESLAILYGNSFKPVASQMVASYPRTLYGTPVISHQLPHSPPYHNQAIWPFVEAYALLAAKQVDDQAAYRHSFRGLTRAAGLFLTHRENYHFATGRPDQTEINSDRQLWSVAAWLSAIYKGLFGLQIVPNFVDDGFDLIVEPNNPFEWNEFSLTDLTLHDTELSIKLTGTGSTIVSFIVNGEKLDAGTPLPLNGKMLDIEIQLEGSQPIRKLETHQFLQPSIPAATWQGDTLYWLASSDQAILELNGRILDTLRSSPLVMPDTLSGFFTLRTLSEAGLKSLPSQPNYLGASATLVLTSQEPYFIEMGKDNYFIRMGFTLQSAGNYLIRFVYSNGAGPINTGNTCGLAKLKVNDWWLEQMVSFPHTNSWDNWQTTNWLKANFQAGENAIVLDQESLPVQNMNGKINVFRVRSVEIVPITQ